MTFSFPELFVSLTIQATVLLLITHWLTSWHRDCRMVDRLWSSCHLLILLLSGLGCFLPHFRLLPRAIWPTEVISFATTAAPSWVPVLFGVWCSGSVLIAMAVACSFFQAARMAACQQPTAEQRRHLQESPSEKLYVAGQPVQILFSPMLVSPFCWQLHRPVIVLPEALLDFPAEERTVVLLHELAHLQAGHPVSLFLQRMVEILFWFHPMVWATSYRANAARELVCDFEACDTAKSAACLLQALYRLSELRTGKRPALPAELAFASDHSILQSRVGQLLQIVENNDRPVGQTGRSVDRCQTTKSTGPLSHQSAGRGFFSGSKGQPQSQLLQFCVAILAMFIWLPFHPAASHRSVLSPWPTASAVALKEMGLPVRDYEIDGFSLQERAAAAKTDPKR